MSQHDADGGGTALRADRLGRRNGRVWGPRDCTFEIPAGAVVVRRTARRPPAAYVPRPTPDAELPGRVIRRTDSDRQSAVLVRADPIRLAMEAHSGWQADPVGFEQLVLAYLQRSSGAATTGRAAARPGPTSAVLKR